MRHSCNGNYFDGIQVPGLKYTQDNSIYTEPLKICVQLTHKCVNLGHFKSFQKDIDMLRSGQKLDVKETGCYFENKRVVKFSNKLQKELEERKEAGYTLSKAYIRHIVYWYNKDKDEELKIILPDIELVKKTCN